jgi:hypothetical protein
MEGAGVRLRRVFGYDQLPLFDPFLMMDDFRSSDPKDYLAGFPWHPHRGIETITYMLEGAVEHADSMGNRGIISAGDVQWMTAGSGIIHQEMPQSNASGRMGGFQFWANLPASHKMMPPRYQEILAAAIPRITLPEGITVKLVSGAIGEVLGPVKDIVISPQLLDVEVPPDVSFQHAIPAGHNAIVYLFSGSAWLGEDGHPPHQEGTAALYEREGECLQVRSGADGARFLLLAGRSLGEPIAWRGPIVMNTQEELRRAFEEYHRGDFIKSAS